MKKILIFSLLTAGVLLSGCKKDDGNDNGGNELVYKELTYPITDAATKAIADIAIGNGDQNYAFAGNATLDKSKVYLLKGWVYITEGSTITIPAGTVIRGDKSTKAALIIERGGKIIAQGTKSEPIVFTSALPAGSRKPGDWGGLVICGKAKNNLGEMQIEGGPRSKHGGSVDNDNSGKLQYVRIEYAGFPFQTDQEINGLTMGSVGSGTTIDHVQVSYSNDDSFEWFGGSVSCSNLVAYHGWDDDFDTDNGFSGNMQFLLGVRHPKVADQSLSNGFESDNNSNATTTTPFTAAKFANVTLVGPIGQHADFINKAGTDGQYISGGGLFPNNGSRTGQYQAAVQIRRNSRISLQHSVIIGYPVGLMIENDKVPGTQAAATANGSTIKNVFFGGYTDNAADVKYPNNATTDQPILGSDINKTWEDVFSANGKDKTTGTRSFSHTYITESTRGNSINGSISDLKLSDPVSITANYAINEAANYGPKADSPLKSIAALTLSGFVSTTYAGAFAGDSAEDNWTAGWCNFNPQTTNYSPAK